MKPINAIKIHRQNPIIWVTVLTLGIVCAMFYTFYIWLNMAERYAPLVDAAMEIKLEATTAHLWFEEIISGDPYINIEGVWGHLDQAEWYARAMLEGGENEEGKYVPLEAPALRHKIEEVLKGIGTFRAIAHKRWALQSQSGVGSNIDQLFDSTFDDFLISADNVETVLQRTMENQFQQFRVVQALLIALIIILGSRFCFLLLRHERRHTNDLLILRNKEETLRETSERFRAAFSDAAIGMALVSLDLRIIETNQALCTML